MPKELTHWMVARAAASRIDEHALPRTAMAIRRCSDAFLLGAVAHDGPFYMRTDPGMAELGDQLHGKGTDDAYAPIQRVLTTTGAAPPSVAIAFAAGAASHIAADTVFHPAVFYFTGFASHPTRAVAGSYMFNHRAFEAALDLHLVSERGRGLDGKLRSLLARAGDGPEAEALWAALGRFYSAADAPLSPAEARAIVDQAAKLQALFSSRSMRLLARLLNLKRAGTNADVSALFYVRKNPWSSHFTSPRPYRHPITGSEGVFDVKDFFDRAVTRALALFQTIERALDGDASAFPCPGPCLDSDHPVHADQLMRHADPRLEAAT
jgi:hypothetical protein